ncbi:hypothetical protein E1293_08130 [Actinomadura darangshiensis]|uniref:Uncharacterized protein n=1 Tax=Actinomadura darangshiensis TaxID=705336 RepID=A0A4R5BTB5_9ACTN|nr:hypothetical protein [Actinomadura darangshiensis]TDD87364.1 hypothetical protein E1293_08130 [Actinomadura darangshiensis]
MTTSGPMGYTARPEAMGALISTLFADRLFEHGIPYLRVGLMTVYVEEHATAELADMKRRPAAEAIGAALGVVAKVWDEAMTMHGMFRQTIDECQRQVRLELEEIVDEHITLVRQAGERGPNPRVEPDQTDSGQNELLPAQMRTLGADPSPKRSGPP